MSREQVAYADRLRTASILCGRLAALPCPVATWLGVAEEPDVKIPVSEYQARYEAEVGKPPPSDPLDRLYRSYTLTTRDPDNPVRKNWDPGAWAGDEEYTRLSLWIYDEQLHFATPHTEGMRLACRTLRHPAFFNLLCVVDGDNVVGATLEDTRRRPGLAAKGLRKPSPTRSR